MRQMFTALQIADMPVRSISRSHGLGEKLTCNRLDVKLCKQSSDKAPFLDIHKVDLHTITKLICIQSTQVNAVKTIYFGRSAGEIARSTFEEGRTEG